MNQCRNSHIPTTLKYDFEESTLLLIYLTVSPFSFRPRRPGPLRARGGSRQRSGPVGPGEWPLAQASWMRMMPWGSWMTM